MKDLQFYQYQDRGPVVWGDLEIAPSGDLAVLTGDEAIDIQDATVRLLTEQGYGPGFAQFPGLGASLSKFVGQRVGMESVQAIDRACERALKADKRFAAAVQCRTIQMGPDSARIYILRGDGSLISTKVDFSNVRGVSPQDERAPSPWLWRRGVALIQQSARLWRAWYEGCVLWRLTPERLVTKKMREESLAALGLFPAPLSVYKGGLLLSGRGPAERLFQPRAWTTAAGWTVDAPVREVDSLPQYQLPDGVWCDEDTHWNLVIIICGETAGQFNESRNRWEFRAISESDTL